MGNNYGLNNSYDYYEFGIDSLDNSGSGDGGYSPLNWPNFYIGGKTPLQSVVAFKILSAQIPFSYYVFGASNNAFMVSTSSTGPWTTVSIPVGNYTSTTLPAVLQTILTPVFGATTVVYNTPQQTFTFTSGGGMYFMFGNSQDDGSTNPRLWIGFTEGISGASTSFTTPNAVQLSGPNYLYVNSSVWGPLINNYVPDAFSATNGNTGPRLAMVPVDSNSGGIIYYKDPDPQKWFFIGDSPTFQKIDFFLSLGNNENVLDLNGLGFSLKMGLLLEKMNYDETMSGLRHENRVTKRSRPY